MSGEGEIDFSDIALAQHTAQGDEEEASSQANSESPPVTSITEKDARPELSPKQRAGKSIAGAKTYIESKKEQLGAEYEGAIAKALAYDGATLSNDSSDSLKSILELLDKIGDPAAHKLRTVLSENVKIKGENGTLYAPDEWQQYLDTLSTDERKRIEQEGLYGFVFPKEQAELAAEGMRVSDELIASQIIRLREVIPTLQEQGQDVSLQEQTLLRLEEAQGANGELGILLKAHAIELAASTTSVNGQPEERALISEQVEKAREQFLAVLKEKGVSEEDVQKITEHMAEGNMDAVIDSGILDRVEGLQEMFLGNLSEEEERARAEALIDTSNLSPEAKQAVKDRMGDLKMSGVLLLMLLMVIIGQVDRK